MRELKHWRIEVQLLCAKYMYYQERPTRVIQQTLHKVSCIQPQRGFKTAKALLKEHFDGTTLVFRTKGP